jgi:para-aminobenzoate synthetase component 1
MVQDAGVAAVPAARFGSRIATDLQEVTSDIRALEQGGCWAVAIPYSGDPVLARFGQWRPGAAADIAGAWLGPDRWQSSLSEEQYRGRVEIIKDYIAQGQVYQANLCRILTAELPDSHARDVGALHALLEREHPAPFAGMLRLPDQDIHICTASPELFLRRNGEVLTSAPIKGTAKTPAQMLEKDSAENIMITDLVRNDLGRICQPGSVRVRELMSAQTHPGLVHLVSTVEGYLNPSVGWAQILQATFPPGSVTGAPKHTALGIIDQCETQAREFYCGAIGWVDTDKQQAVLAVGIRTFWIKGARIAFGTGAGITWGSDPTLEWHETMLKAERLIEIASGTW